MAAPRSQDAASPRPGCGPTSPAPGAAAAPDPLRGFAASWLRVNCTCARCRDPHSGQRLAAIADLPDEVTVAAVRETADDITVTFGPDGHEGVFGRSWLAGQAAPAADERCEDAKRLWSAGDFAGGPPSWRWPDYLARAGARRDCLATLLRDGLAVLRGVPCEPGAVLAVARRMGYVRETNYGRLFDVRVTATPSNLAFSSLPIAPHTDNPYRDPVPTVQLLHCLVSDVSGGETGLADGFAAAGILRRERPEAFALLAGTPVTFRYADAEAELTATRPVIGVDPAGRIREIRVNDRSMQPWRPPRPRPGVPPGDPAAGGAAFYAAYRAFAAILRRPGLLLTFRLAPGDCVVFDNTRVLHARTGFAAAGRRHLQGCYADLDGVASTLAVLCRRTST